MIRFIPIGKYRIPYLILGMLLTFTTINANGSTFENIIIYKQNNIYACFPNVYKIRDNSAVVSFYKRHTTSHYDPNGQTIQLITIDSGKTWNIAKDNPINPVYYDNNENIAAPYIHGWKEVYPADAAQLRNSNILIEKDNGKQYFSIGCGIKTSTNNGLTWSYRDIILPPHALLTCYNMSSYLKTKSGMSMYALYGRLNINDKNQVFLLRSDTNWKLTSFYPMYKSLTCNDLSLSETALAELSDGRILAFIRATRNSNEHLYSSISHDAGITWTEPKSLPFEGYPANLLIWKDKIICSYGYRDNPIGIRIAILDQNLNIERMIILRNDGAGQARDTGYPMTIEISPRIFLTVYYITTIDGVTHIAATKWNID